MQYDEDADGYRSDYGEELDGADGIYQDQLEEYWEEEVDYNLADAGGKRKKGKSKNDD